MSAIVTPSGVTGPTPVVIDTDPGIDDALALMLALRSPELEVRLITTVAGNVPVGLTTRNAARVLARVDPRRWPPLVKGAARPLHGRGAHATHVHGDDGLGGITRLRDRAGNERWPHPGNLRIGTQASRHLVASAKTHGPKLTVIALGPLTNIARAVQADVDAMRSIGRLIIMGGAVRVRGNVTPTAEFNIFVDPVAAAIVLGAGIPTTLMPLDVTRQVALSDTGFEIGRLSRLGRDVKSLTARVRERYGTLTLHDPLAVAVAIDPTLVQTEPFRVDVETTGQRTLGMTIAYEPTSAHSTDTAGTIDVATRVDAGRALDLFSQRVLRAPHRSTRSPRGNVLVVGSANVDLSVGVASLPRPGETVLGGTLETHFGGKGANQAIAARRAGGMVGLVARLGTDANAQRYRAYLHAQGIDTSCVSADDETPTGIAMITVDRHGQNQITVASGANARLSPEALPPLGAWLERGGVVVGQLEVPTETVETVFRQARSARAITLLNAAPMRPLPRALLDVVDVLVCNEIEASELTRTEVGNIRGAKRATRTLLGLGVASVVITLGASGVVFASREHPPRRLRASRAAVVDTTGAGDTFVGYLAAELAAGSSLESAVSIASRAAATCVTRRGAASSIPHRHELEI